MDQKIPQASRYRPIFQLGDRLFLAMFVLLSMLVIIALVIEGLLILIHANALQDAIEDGATVAAFQLDQGKSTQQSQDIVLQFVTQNEIEPKVLELNTCETVARTEWQAPRYEILACGQGQGNHLLVYAELNYQPVFLHLAGISSITLRSNVIADIATAELR